MPTGPVQIVGTQTILLVSVLVAKPQFLPVCKIILGTPRVIVWRGCGEGNGSLGCSVTLKGLKVE